jgi:NAD-dependent dihydropyrimidine dehydrogenase PreA subunit
MALDFLPQIDVIKCTGCELCLKVCPNHVFSLVNGVAVVSRPQACDYTGDCQEICPTKAVTLLYEIVFFKENREEV